MLSPTVEENKPYYMQRKYNDYLQNSLRVIKNAAVLNFSHSERKKKKKEKSKKRGKKIGPGQILKSRCT